jgi:SAM-dependent methyltransferase
VANREMAEIIISPIDIEHLQVIRSNIVDFMKYVAQVYANKPGKLLDIAPQIHEGATPFFEKFIAIDTFDIDPNSGCTYIGDICRRNECIPDASYNYVVCTEVLEHTLQPFNAVKEIWRILKPSGFLFASVPFNFRIHGPLPDCWRFTEHGLRVLLKELSILELNSVETFERTLMPVHYTVVAQKL